MTTKDRVLHMMRMGAMCKAASRGLGKEARAPAVVMRSGSRVGDALGRYVSLLFGSPAVRGSYLLRAKQLRRQMAEASRDLRRMAPDAPGRDALYGKIVDLNRGIREALAPIRGETNKVWAARLGTGALGLTGIGLYGNSRPSPPVEEEA